MLAIWALITLVFVGAFVLALALARTASCNEGPALTEMAARQRVRPTTAGIDVEPFAAHGLEVLRQSGERADDAMALAEMNRRALRGFDR